MVRRYYESDLRSNIIFVRLATFRNRNGLEGSTDAVKAMGFGGPYIEELCYVARNKHINVSTILIKCDRLFVAKQLYVIRGF